MKRVANRGSPVGVERVAAPGLGVRFGEQLPDHRGTAAAPKSTAFSGPVPEAVRVCLGGNVSREDCRHSLAVTQARVVARSVFNNHSPKCLPNPRALVA